MAWAMRRLYALAGRQRQATLRIACTGSAQRRHRRRLLSSIFTSWRKDLLEAERIFRIRCRNTEARTKTRLCRAAFRAWTELDDYFRKLHRFVTVLRRAWRQSGLRLWRTQAARWSAKAVAERFGTEALHRALAQQKVGCEYFVEARSRECATRTGKVLLHAWRCAASAETAFKEKRFCAAHFLLRTLAGHERYSRKVALQRWRATSKAMCVEVVAHEAAAQRAEEGKQMRMRNGLQILATLVTHRLHLGMAQAFHGQWRALRWQSMVRALDASVARDQRRMMAESDHLRAQLLACREEAFESRARTAAEEERGDRTRQEAEEIVEAVRRERASQVGKMATLESSEAQALEQSQELQFQLDQALAQVSRLEDQKRDTDGDLRALHLELQDARLQGEELSQAEMHRERAFHEQVQALQQQALSSQHAVQDAERDFRHQLDRLETEAKEAAEKSELTMEFRLQEKQRAVELQASIAEDQERNIRHLESLLKEQGDQLSRERNDHMRGLESLRASASLSESKSCLLQEQVVALRQQLQREHQELLASEKAWSSDRAALLSAVASQEPLALRPPARTRSSSASRRKASPSPKDPGGSVSVARCPWHGPGSAKKLAPALM